MAVRHADTYAPLQARHVLVGNIDGMRHDDGGRERAAVRAGGPLRDLPDHRRGIARPAPCTAKRTAIEQRVGWTGMGAGTGGRGVTYADASMDCCGCHEQIKTCARAIGDDKQHRFGHDALGTAPVAGGPPTSDSCPRRIVTSWSGIRFRSLSSSGSADSAGGRGVGASSAGAPEAPAPVLAPEAWAGVVSGGCAG